MGSFIIFDGKILMRRCRKRLLLQARTNENNSAGASSLSKNVGTMDAQLGKKTFQLKPSITRIT